MVKRIIGDLALHNDAKFDSDIVLRGNIICDWKEYGFKRFDLAVNGNIDAEYIAAGILKATDINGFDINAREIYASKINAANVNAETIVCDEISAYHITVHKLLKAVDIRSNGVIECERIEAANIEARVLIANDTIKLDPAGATTAKVILKKADLGHINSVSAQP